MKYKINLTSYYTQEILKAGFIFNNKNGCYEYFINNKPVISVKSWNNEFEFNAGISNKEMPEFIKIMKDINQYYYVEKLGLDKEENNE